MNEMTHETLRALANDFLHEDWGEATDNAIRAGNGVKEHADAWEQQEGPWLERDKLMSEHVLSVQNRNGALEAEAAELRAELALQTERSLSSWVIDALVKRGFKVEAQLPPVPETPA
jgi:hypothetical protein